MSDSDLQQATAALNGGHKTEARRLLKKVVQVDPRSERGWLWLSEAVDTNAEQRFCLSRVLSINRRNALARRNLEALGEGAVRSPFERETKKPASQTTDNNRRGSRDPVIPVALGYLVALTLAEELTTLAEPWIGLWVYGSLLVLLILHTTLTWRYPLHKLLLSLTFVPLIRILSLSLPLATFPLIYWYVITSVPLLVTAVLIAHTLGFSWRGIGLNLRRLPVQALISLTGLAFGYIEYRLLQPAPLVQVTSWKQLWAPTLVLLICTGFTEELIFRGVMQQATKEVIGNLAGLYVSALFAVLHVGHKSWLDVLFVFGVGLFFAWVVTKTRSLLGVTLSHGLTNIILFLIGPFMLAPHAG
jgi:membrane protease YdiL (CAAX protease family)